MTMTRDEALRELAVDAHGIVNEALARAISEPFGFVPVVPVMTDTRNHYKGAALPGCTRAGQQTRAVGVRELAYQVAARLALDTSRADRMLGRGSATRELVRAIREHVESQT